MINQHLVLESEPWCPQTNWFRVFIVNCYFQMLILLLFLHSKPLDLESWAEFPPSNWELSRKNHKFPHLRMAHDHFVTKLHTLGLRMRISTADVTFAAFDEDSLFTLFSVSIIWSHTWWWCMKSRYREYLWFLMRDIDDGDADDDQLIVLIRMLVWLTAEFFWFNMLMRMVWLTAEYFWF